MRLAVGRAGGQAAVVALLLAVAVRAAAQTSGAPGPWVADVRAATAGAPADAAFFPPLSADTLIPSRGFGVDAGAHVYLFPLGPSRMGVGASYLHVRGTSDTVTATVRALAPQVSVNFGTTHGWSYLSGGVGRASVRTEIATETGTLERDSGGVTAVNVGGGARWFLTGHLGIGFDVRWHRLSGPARVTILAAAAGFSVH